MQESEQELDAGRLVAEKADSCLRENFNDFVLTKAMAEAVLRNRRKQRSAASLFGADDNK